MAERIHIQHFHSTTATTISDAVKEDLFSGEIGLLTTDGSEKVFFENSIGELVTISSDEKNETKFSPITHTHNNLTFSSGSTSSFNKVEYTPGSTTTTKTINIPTKFSHLTNDTGTITGVTAGSGLTGGGTVDSDEKGVTLNVGAGTGIAVAADAVSISDEYQNKINSGVTAYNWGNHANAGYASKSTLDTHISGFTSHVNTKATTTPAGGVATFGHVALISGDVKNTTYTEGVAAAASHTHSQYALGSNLNDHTGDTIIHITDTERTNWNNTKTRLDTFLSGATLSGDVIDTLTEIQGYITGDKADAAKLVSDVATISGNLSTHVATSATTSTLGHVIIDNSDLKNKTNVNGKVAGLAHTHSQYLTGYTETYEGTITGITVTGIDGLTGTGTISASSGKTGGTINVSHSSPITNSGTTTVDFTNKNGTNITFGGSFTKLSSLKYDKNGHIISAGATTITLPTLPEADNDNKGIVKLRNDELTLIDSLVGKSDGVAAGAGHTHAQYLTAVTLDNHYTPLSSETKSVSATEIITGITMDGKGHVTGVNKGSYTIATSVPANAIFTDTHHTGMTVVTNSSTGKTTATTISDGSVRLNHIENNTVKSSILLKSDAFCDVKGTAANQITFSIVTGTSASSVARGDHSHSAYVNQNAFSNVKVGDTTIEAESTQDTLELVAGESISLTPDATNDKITIAVTSINCGTF